MLLVQLYLNVLYIIRSEEDNLRREFQEMKDHMLEHFTEEESFWPRILKRCGEANWAKIEPLILAETEKYGDMN